MTANDYKMSTTFCKHKLQQ